MMFVPSVLFAGGKKDTLEADGVTEKVKELNSFLYNFGYKIKISKEDVIYPNEFAKILEDVKGKDEEKVVSNIILRNYTDLCIQIRH